MEENHGDYQRVAKAIAFLSKNYQNQPDLEAVAREVHLSPQHFQRIFTNWAGVSPKKYVQFLALAHLRERIFDVSNLEKAAELVGFSAQSRVYDLFVSIEGVTPNAFKTFGKGLKIEYGFHETPFGACLLATTNGKICFLSFLENEQKQTEIDRFHAKWQAAERIFSPESTAAIAAQIFEKKANQKISLLVQGTNFQLKVWEALLNIPTGAVTTYQNIAEKIESPKAVRAVGTAVGQNPVALLIPCHRVIRKEGKIGEYHWGSDRKRAILGHEMAITSQK
jgi:AraC family transcriptional regulator, regulatory protein of adaptative response / methylated-DNA-[protein]-cysteine methyltransferase